MVERNLVGSRVRSTICKSDSYTGEVRVLWPVMQTSHFKIGARTIAAFYERIIGRLRTDFVALVVVAWAD